MMMIMRRLNYYITKTSGGRKFLPRVIPDSVRIPVKVELRKLDGLFLLHLHPAFRFTHLYPLAYLSDWW